MTAPPRSLLYVPASQPRMLAKLADLAADVVVLDLEDGVAPDAKDGAREALRALADRGGLPTSGRWMLRVNAVGSPWHDDDLDLVAELRPPGVLLAKAGRAHDVEVLAAQWAAEGAYTGLMIETARGLGCVRELAGAHGRVALLVYGSADLRRELGARPDPARTWERHAMSEIVLAARMRGAAAIDAVHFRFRDLAALAQDARIARDLGFDGKSCIHPGQLPTVHEIFRSSADEIAWAEAVLAGWEREHGERRGVVVVDGEMIERLHLDVARRILERR